MKHISDETIEIFEVSTYTHGDKFIVDLKDNNGLLLEGRIYDTEEEVNEFKQSLIV